MGDPNKDLKGEEEDEFVVVEVDDKGVPLNSEPDGEDPDPDKDDPDAEGGEDVTDGSDDDDERVGHAEGEQDNAREGETVEERRERRRRENKARRIRREVTSRTKDQMLEQQGQMLLQMQEQVAQLQGRTVQYDVNLLQGRLGQIEQQQQEAKALMAKLVKAGDGEGVAEVTELQLQLRDQHRHLDLMLKRAKTVQDEQAKKGTPDTKAAPAAPARPAVDPVVKKLAQQWADRNKWFDPRKGGEQVEIVAGIDRALIKDGWDPRDQDYWDELTDRAKRYFPQHFKKGGRVNGDGKERNAGRGAGPNMPSNVQTGRRPLGKNEVLVTPERKKAMIDAGKWDDPEKRNRQLAAYAKYDREHAGNN